MQIFYFYCVCLTQRRADGGRGETTPPPVKFKEAETGQERFAGGAEFLAMQLFFKKTMYTSVYVSNMVR